ncbi:phage regulatory CII family protein [Microvirga zambiensis]|uniref:phage regulatory CII family protein n=1 Tax=Microvirga zambiensis TaxID=1402137 RepID=UPI00191D793B|nr:phage regulatory CII family protein [Microvirga zambiensis]
MHPTRSTTEQDRFSLKASFRQLLKRAGGQEAAELVTRGRHQTLNRYGNPKEEDCHAPIDVIADLEREIGDPIVTKHLADMSGYMLVKKIAVEADANLLVHISALAGETGEAVQAAVEAYADGTDTDEELENIVKQATDAEHAAASMRIAAQAKLDARKNITRIRGSVA